MEYRIQVLYQGQNGGEIPHHRVGEGESDDEAVREALDFVKKSDVHSTRLRVARFGDGSKLGTLIYENGKRCEEPLSEEWPPKVEMPRLMTPSDLRLITNGRVSWEGHL